MILNIDNDCTVKHSPLSLRIALIRIVLQQCQQLFSSEKKVILIAYHRPLFSCYKSLQSTTLRMTRYLLNYQNGRHFLCFVRTKNIHKSSHPKVGNGRNACKQSFVLTVVFFLSINEVYFKVYYHLQHSYANSYSNSPPEDGRTALSRNILLS